MRKQHFERHKAIEAYLASLPHLAHGSFAKFSDELEIAQDFFAGTYRFVGHVHRLALAQNTRGAQRMRTPIKVLGIFWDRREGVPIALFFIRPGSARSGVMRGQWQS